jgi:hypothetical protein
LGFSASFVWPIVKTIRAEWFPAQAVKGEGDPYKKTSESAEDGF